MLWSDTFIFPFASNASNTLEKIGEYGIINSRQFESVIQVNFNLSFSMLAFIYKLFEKLDNKLTLNVWCIIITCAGIGACVLNGVLLGDYLEWISAKERFERDLSALDSRYKEDSKKVTELKLEVVSFEKKKNQLLAIEKRIAELQGPLAEKEKKDSQLTGSIDQKNQELQAKTKEVGAVTERLTAANAELAALSTRVEQSKAEFEQMKASNSALLDDTQQKKETLKQLNGQIAELEQNKQNTQNQVNAVQQSLSEVQGRLSADQQEETQLGERLKSLRKERDAVQHQLAELQSNIDSLTSSRGNTRRLELERNLAALQERKQALDTELGQKSNEAKEAANTLADLVRIRDVAKAECESLDALKSEKQTQLDMIKREYDSTDQRKQALESEITRTNGDLQTVKQSIRELEKKKRELLEECDRLEAVLEQKRAGIQRAEQSTSVENK